MTDTTEFHDANSIGADNDIHVIAPGSDINSHEYREIDRRQLFQVNGLTAYELTVECKTNDCSQNADLILAKGDFPESPAEIDDLMYSVYRWFHDNAADLLPYKEAVSVYIATYALIVGEENTRSLLRSRIALFLAADTGYRDGQQNRTLKQKEELLRTTKQQTRSSLQRLESDHHPVLKRLD